MSYYFGRNGYYEGARVSILDREVPRRPSLRHQWNGERWITLRDRTTLHRLISNDAIDPDGTGVWPHAQIHARDAAAAVYAALTGMGDETALEQDLKGFLLRLKDELAANGNPFSGVQLTAIDGFLDEAGFEWRVGDLFIG